MRIATNQLYNFNINNMQNAYNNIAKLQQQISSGKKISLIKEDVDAGSKIVTINNKIIQNNNYKNNITNTQQNFNLSDTTLKQANNLLQQIRNLVLGLGNGDIVPEDCTNAANQITDIMDDLLNLANTQDEFGNFIFGGNNNKVPYIKDISGNIIYQGSKENNQVKLNDNLTINNKENAFNIFETSNCFNNLTVLKNKLLNINNELSHHNIIDDIKDSIKDSINNGIKNINNDKKPETAAIKEIKKYALDTGLKNIDKAMSNVTNIRTNIGIKLNTLDNCLADNIDYDIYLQNNLSKLQDTDPLYAMSKLELTKTIFEASQMSFIKMMNTNLLNKISI